MLLEVRDARMSDADTIIAFNRAMARETEGLELAPEVVDRGVRALLADAAKGSYFLAVERETARLVGQIMVTYEWSDWRDGSFWWIQSVYVHPDARRRGVYRALHAHVVELAHRADARGVRLYVERDNRTAQTTYRALGMAVTHYHIYETVFTR